MKQYQGSCHCGRIAFEVEGDLDQVFECNCSICRRKGAPLWMVPATQFRLLTPTADLADYTFNKHLIHHRFCPTCGIHPFGQGATPAGDAMVAVNVRCLDDVDLSTLTVTHFDGKSL